ncbi:MAG: glucose-1-phosphate thymidylyltransferase [Methanolinea sp. SDB]|nr:MAG: glucose-1-phosphate thymidylyltransferase [Methanolinea sp. SDB]
MQCVILAAGEGKRMRPLTSRRPKVMLPLANVPMLGHLVTAVRQAGIDEVVLVVGYGEREVRKYCGDGSTFGLSISYVTQRYQKGTADALYAARNLIDDTFLLMNGDMIIRKADIEVIKQMQAPCMGIYHSDHPEDYGVVTVGESRVTKLEEKTDKPAGDLINAGIYLFDADIIDLLESVKCSSRGEYELTDALGAYIRDDILGFFRLTSWLDVGFPWDLLAANEILLGDLQPSCRGLVEDGTCINGPVSIGEGTVIKSGSYIEGPCIIGNDCRIGPHAHIRGSTSIGERCHIGHCTEVKNSVIMNDTKIPHFNYLGDSVVGTGCNFGAGTKVANLRHDHRTVKIGGRDTKRVKMGAIIADNVRFGINCSVNVGTVVGSNVGIAPHSFVDGWIDEYSVIG